MIRRASHVPAINNSHVGLQKQQQQKQRAVTEQDSNSGPGRTKAKSVAGRSAGKTMMQQNVNQQTTAMRKPSGPQRAQKRAPMTTEYRESFLPPSCHKVITTTSREKGPYHALKGTSYDVTTLQSFYVTHKCIKRPPKPQKPSQTPKDEDYKSVYQSDFQAWKGNKCQPYNQVDRLSVHEGLVGPSNEGRCKKTSIPVPSEPVPLVQKPKPFEQVTSYRCDFVAHPVQPRTRSQKPVCDTRGLISGPVGSPKKTVAWERNQERFDESSVILSNSRVGLETKLPNQVHQSQITTASFPQLLNLQRATKQPERRQAFVVRPERPQAGIPVATPPRTQHFPAWDTCPLGLKNPGCAGPSLWTEERPINQLHDFQQNLSSPGVQAQVVPTFKAISVIKEH